MTIRIKFRKVYLSLFFLLFFCSLPSQVFAEKNVIITFKKEVDPYVVQQLKNSNSTIKYINSNVGSVSATIPDSMLPILQSQPFVEHVELDAKVKIMKEELDYGIGKTNTPRAWNLGYSGKRIKVAVLDTGITPHEDLVISGGVSFITGENYHDEFGHGTHVAGIIGAKKNGFGVTGVAPDSKIYAVRVLDRYGGGAISNIVSGIDWSIQNNMDIINLSIGLQEDYPALKQAIKRAIDAGIVVVASSGNDFAEESYLGGCGWNYYANCVDYPARYDNVIAVGATDEFNDITFFSSIGPTVDFVAPGYEVLSTFPTNQYAWLSGTSMASPYAAGVVALYKEAYPHYNAQQMTTILKQYAIDLGKKGKDNTYGYGLVQAPNFKKPVSKKIYASKGGAKAYKKMNKAGQYYKVFPIASLLDATYIGNNWYYGYLNDNLVYFHEDEVQGLKPFVGKTVYIERHGVQSYVQQNQKGAKGAAYKKGTTVTVTYLGNYWYYGYEKGKIVYFHEDDVQGSMPKFIGKVLYAERHNATSYTAMDKETTTGKSYKKGDEIEALYVGDKWYYGYENGQKVYYHEDDVQGSKPTFIGKIVYIERSGATAYTDITKKTPIGTIYNLGDEVEVIYQGNLWYYSVIKGQKVYFHEDDVQGSKPKFIEETMYLKAEVTVSYLDKNYESYYKVHYKGEVFTAVQDGNDWYYSIDADGTKFYLRSIDLQKNNPNL